MDKIYQVSPEVAGKIMGKSADWIRQGLKRGMLPIGTAFQIRGKAYSYYISPALLMQYTGCSEKDIKEAIREV